jgi:hypothetical protein
MQADMNKRGILEPSLWQLMHTFEPYPGSLREYGSRGLVHYLEECMKNLEELEKQ